jgi:hypothetical protein
VGCVAEVSEEKSGPFRGQWFFFCFLSQPYFRCPCCPETGLHLPSTSHVSDWLILLHISIIPSIYVISQYKPYNFNTLLLWILAMKSVRSYETSTTPLTSRRCHHPKVRSTLTINHRESLKSLIKIPQLGRRKSVFIILTRFHNWATSEKPYF